MIKLEYIIFTFITAISLKSFSQEQITWKQAINQPEEWFNSNEAIRIANNLLLYQSDNGGWAKNIDMAKEITSKEIKEAKASNRNHINETTIDNRSTYTQIEYLAKVYNATNIKKYKNSCLDGINYLLDAQYRNGGWAQFHPTKKGYYSHITFNDGAIIGVISFLKRVSEGEFSFVDKNMQNKCKLSVNKGIDAILKCQIKVNDELTAWCAQHDENTFQPAKARAYELPSISGAESVGIVEFLMTIDNPSPEIVAAINSAIKWLKKVQINEVELVDLGNNDYTMVINTCSTRPLWARFYEIDTNYPIFVGRDGKIKYSVNEIEQERRVGYKWLSNWAEKTLNKSYPQWCKKWNIESCI